MRQEETRTLYTLACSCGAKVTLDARQFGKPQVCKKCGNQFTVAWGKDARSGRNTPMMVSLARKKPAMPLRVVCSCGYKRAVTAAEAHRQNRCPGCGKVMIVEKPPAPKNGRDSNRIIKLSSAPSTPSMPLMPLPTKETPESRSRRVNPPTPVPNFDKPGLICECGRNIEVLKAMADGDYTCPSCGRSVRMEKIKGSSSKHTIIRPIFGPKTPPPPTSTKPAPSKPPPPAPKAPKAPEPEAVFAGEESAEFVEEGAAATVSSSSLQEVFCPCGEALMVGYEDAGKNIQCPTCLTLMAVDALKDSKTGGKALRVRAIGKMDQDTWSLNDFQ